MGFWRELWRVYLATVLRDMRTRFGGSYLTYGIAIGWPLTHMCIIYLTYTFYAKVSPLGGDPGIFVATGIAPFILTLYATRHMSLAFVHGGPLLQFPIVQPIHLLAARMSLEFLNAAVILLLFMIFLTIVGSPAVPENPTQAFFAILLTMYFGVSVGTIGAAAFCVWGSLGMMTVVMSVLIMYLASGVMVPTYMLSSQIKALAEYNPLYHSVGLIRASYYGVFSFEEFSSFYLFVCASGCLLVGLAAERMVRGKLLRPSL